MDSFPNEVNLKSCKTLAEFNRYFQVWVTECYHVRGHAGLKGLTPETAYKYVKEPLRFASPETVAAAFLHEERRKVDKSGCIQFQGKRYEIFVLLVGQKVSVVYDPGDTETLTVQFGELTLQAQPLRIWEHTGPRPKLPASMLPALPATSRLLDGKEKQFDSRRDVVRRAIQFDGLEGGEDDV